MHHYYYILFCTPIDCSLTITFNHFSSCWPGLDRSLDVMSTRVSVALFYTMTKHSLMGSARGCPGSTCISPVWLDRCKLSLSLARLAGTDVILSYSIQCFIPGPYLISTRC